MKLFQNKLRTVPVYITVCNIDFVLLLSQDLIHVCLFGFVAVWPS